MLYIFWFLHQTTTNIQHVRILNSCISFDSYIKPQPIMYTIYLNHVVYLLIPTSNHNLALHHVAPLQVVYLLIPTSNHNTPRMYILPSSLYIFWFLHQTTTCGCRYPRGPQVVYLLIPTSNHNLPLLPPLPRRVVYLLIPTSNHNHSSLIKVLN